MAKENTELWEAFDGMQAMAIGVTKLGMVIRFKGAPFMRVAHEAGFENSVGAHQGECGQLWSMLRKILPNLAAAVDCAEVYDWLMNHDVGETAEKGDVSVYDKLNGATDDKGVEKRQLEILAAGLPVNLRRELVQGFEMFEADEERIEKPEVLVAKLIDSMQGNIVVLGKGNNLDEFSDKIIKILEIRFIRRAKRLIEVLELKQKPEAADEVRVLGLHHLAEYRKRGVNVELTVLAKNSDQKG